MQARQSKPAQIYHGARASGMATSDTMDDAVLKIGESLAAASACVPSSKIANLQILANIGVQYSALQKEIAKHVQEVSGVNVTDCLQRLEQHFVSVKEGSYVTGPLLSPTDCSLVCAASASLTLLFTIRPYPRIAAWFTCITREQWCMDILGPQRALGTQRIGGQIDLRPNPVDSYAHAMRSILCNAGQKKKETQRQKEKKSKQAGKQQSAGESKSQSKSNPMDASENAADDASLPFLLGPRVEVDAGKEQRMATLFDTLKRIGISSTTEKHPATATVEELMRETGHLPGGHCKNLFVKGKKISKTRKNDSKLWLIVALHDTVVDMKKLSKFLGYKAAMRMGNKELLNEKLAVIQGEVSPLALTNNSERDVQVVLDAGMMKKEVLWFHPLTMEASTCLTPKDLLQYIEASGRKAEIVDFQSL